MLTVNTSCRACQSAKLTKVIDLGAQPLANAFLKKEQLSRPEPKYPLEVYFCEDCNLAQLIHVVDKSVLFEDYIYFSSGMPKLSDHFKKYAEDVIARFLRYPDELVVEIGSNDGILLQFFKNNNLNHASSKTLSVIKLRVVVEDRIGILKDVTNAISSHKINILSAKSEGGRDPYHYLNFLIESKNKHKLPALIFATKKIKGVKEVSYKV